MSLILDALKRAERERRGESGPPQADVAMPAAGTPAPPRATRFLGPAFVVGGLALGALLLWDAFRTPAPAPVAPAPSPQAQAQQQPQPIKARPAPSRPSVVPGTEDVASLDDLTDEPELEASAPPASAAPSAATPPVPAKPAPAKAKPAPAKPVTVPPETESPRTATVETTPAPPPQAGEVQPSEPAASPSPPVAAPAPAPARTEPAAPAQIPPALTQPAPLRKFREMPPDYRADFPALRVEIHVYEKVPARRFVMVNGRRYREGERMAEGPMLVEIVPDGMVLEHRGEKVLYTLSR